jgi:hypothetical protein
LLEVLIVNPAEFIVAYCFCSSRSDEFNANAVDAIVDLDMDVSTPIAPNRILLVITQQYGFALMHKEFK